MFYNFSVCGSSQEILDYWISNQLSLLKDIVDMQTNILFCRIKQQRHLRLREPYGLILHPHLQPNALIRLIHNDFAISHNTFSLS